MGWMREFREFAVKGNAIDLAVGLVLGAAFGRIVTSLVDDVVMPPIGLLLGGVDFTNLFWSLGPSHFATLAQAQEAGAPTLNYGRFLQTVLDFLIVALAVFFMVRGINRLRRKEEAAAPAAPAEEVVLLREIRDSLARAAPPALLALALLSALGAAACRPAGDAGTQGAGTAQGSEPAAAPAAAGDAVARGRYLVTILACNDCHTPFKMGANGPEPDMARMLSGHPESVAMPPAPALQAPWAWTGAITNTAFAGPWGVSYANNLTPDQNTGIGVWTEEVFVRTLRTGRHWGAARPILPPMPWPSYARMTDDDLKAIYAYLRTIPAIQNRTPESVPAAPGSQPPGQTGGPTGQPGAPAIQPPGAAPGQPGAPIGQPDTAPAQPGATGQPGAATGASGQPGAATGQPGSGLPEPTEPPPAGS